MLRKTQNWGHRNSTLDHFGDVDVVNKYFTSVVCDIEGLNCWNML